MNEKKEFLTEENYEKGKKSLAKIIKIVLTVGLSISALLIVSGIIVIATSNNSKIEEEKEEIVYESKVRTEEEINNDINETKNRINELNQKLPALKAEKNAEFRNNTGFTQRYYELGSQISAIEEEIRDLEVKKFELENELETRDSDLEQEKIEQEFNNAFSDMDNESKGFVKKGLGGVLIFAGFGVIPPTLMISGGLYLIYKRREITVFTTQQTMPIAQEGIDKMAPTIGNAAGTIAGSVAEGITKGIKKGKEDE